MPSSLSRRALLQRAGLTALAASGFYAAIDELSAAPARAALRKVGRGPEQYLIPGLQVITDNGVPVIVPPLHHLVVTATLTVGTSRKELREAQALMEHELALLDAQFAPGPGGLSFVVGWGLPYFERYLPQLRSGRRPLGYLPRDLVASATAGRPVSVLLDAVRFPSDAANTVLERNELSLVFRSDSAANVEEGSSKLLHSLAGLLRLQSIRKGFIGGGFGGGRSLPKAMAMRAGIPGAEAIPESAQLFLGLTSTQVGGAGPKRIASFESLPGVTDQWPRGAFRGGTTMHLSHLYEDIELWYGQFNDIRRMWQATDAGRAEFIAGPLTLSAGPDEVQSLEQIQRFAIADDEGDSGIAGHSATMHPVNRLHAAVRDNHGDRYGRGTAILNRADFNTLDNPFAWSARPEKDRMRSKPRAGLHFISFSPTSDFFHRLRQAMDGRYADGVRLPLGPHAQGLGMNSVLTTTHRQNFLVPPRNRRSFPLVELL